MPEQLDILQRLTRLEQAVFGNQLSKANLSNLQEDFFSLAEKIKQFISPMLSDLDDDDWLVFQIVLPKNKKINSGRFQTTSLQMLLKEEHNEKIAQLCSVLSSKQRLNILKLLIQDSLSSGELVKLTGMPGGHLHHHLKDLLKIDLLKKDEDNRYEVTERGISVYLTIASIYRQLSYDDRELFWQSLQDIK